MVRVEHDDGDILPLPTYTYIFASRKDAAAFAKRIEKLPGESVILIAGKQECVRLLSVESAWRKFNNEVCIEEDDA
jgi:hypothetical protein